MDSAYAALSKIGKAISEKSLDRGLYVSADWMFESKQERT